MIPAGIHFDIPESVYHADPAWSYSRVKKAQPTMAHYKAWKDETKRTGTSYMDIGTLIGRLVLEPDRPAMDGFAIKPKPRAPNGWEDEQRQAGFMVLSERDVEEAKGCAKAIRSHPIAGPILTDAGHSEVTLVHEQDLEVDGVLVPIRIKIRIDRVPAGQDFLCDLKKVQDCRPGEYRQGKDDMYFVQSPFAKTVGQLDYHMQAGIYTYVWNNVVPGDPRHKWVNVCVEQDAPHLVRVFQMADNAIAAGLDKFWRLLKGIIKCEMTGVWPGYKDEIEVVDLERWQA
jgi:hypothetical protein